MTEQEYLASDDPVVMLDWLVQHHAPSDRKLRLAMCAMSRASAFDSFELMRRVSLAERWADGEIDREAVVADAPGEPTSWRAWVVTHHITRDAAEWASQSFKWCAPFVLREVFGNSLQPVTLPLGEPCKKCRGRGERLLRDEHPELSHPKDRRRAWCSVCNGTGHGPSPVLTPLVLQLAEAAYTVRTGTGALDNEALAVLSDALEEAGLEGPWDAVMVRQTRRSVGHIEHRNVLHPILAHLRDPGPHYRGCWALDLLLGKE